MRPLHISVATVALAATVMTITGCSDGNNNDTSFTSTAPAVTRTPDPTEANPVVDTWECGPSIDELKAPKNTALCVVGLTRQNTSESTINLNQTQYALHSSADSVSQVDQALTEKVDPGALSGTLEPGASRTITLVFGFPLEEQPTKLSVMKSSGVTTVDLQPQ